MFLSITAEGHSKSVQHQVLTETTAMLEKLVLQFPDDTKLSNDLWEIRSKELKGWKLPQSFHITTLYVGKSKKIYETHQDWINNFLPNIDFPFSVCAVAYIPGGIMAGVTFPDRAKVNIDNKFPHMTMMTCNKFAPVMSNNLLTQMFDEDKPLEKFYSQERLMEMDSACRTSVWIKGLKHEAYLVPLHRVM
jgi:hypothetical protein